MSTLERVRRTGRAAARRPATLLLLGIHVLVWARRRRSRAELEPLEVPPLRGLPRVEQAEEPRIHIGLGL